MNAHDKLMAALEVLNDYNVDWKHIDEVITAYREYKAEQEAGKGPQPIPMVIPDLVHLYNIGYMAGHEATVESCFTPIHPDDWTSYHDDIVMEWLTETGYKLPEGG